MLLRVVTLNVWGLPWPISADLPHRLRAIGERFGGLDAHIIGIQEVWTEAARKQIIEAGRRAGFDSVWHNDATIGGGGLLLLSRLPIADVHFEPYVVRGLPEKILHLDYYAGKGVTLATITTDTGPVVVALTHMHASYALPGRRDIYEGHRVAQIVQFAAALSQVSLPVIALGDFNFRESEPAHPIFVGLTGLSDVAIALDRREPTVSKSNPYREDSEKPDRRIDYVFVRSGASRSAFPISIERVFDEVLSFDDRAGAPSDHAGLAAEVRITPGGEGVPAIDTSVIPRAFALIDQGSDEARDRRRNHRTLAGVATLTGGLTFATARARRKITRRRFLEVALYGTAGLGFLTAADRLVLSEMSVPTELDELAEARELLARLTR